MSDKRVRFAPSPTGYLHIGGARTALFNFLFARHEKGKFILRIEDTDEQRSTSEYEEKMLEDMIWLGLKWDEGPSAGGDCGPYRQSQRIEIYREYSEKLVEEGKAYPCYCTDEELVRKRDKMKREGVPPQYDGTCRDLTEEDRKERRKAGLPESIRFIVPAGEEKRINDIARGEVVFPPGMVGDFVILRSNGLPTYNFAAAVDDALMRISHVIRGSEHLSNTLRQVMIYEALGLEMPLFAHIPLILGPDRTKLSKRHGAPNIRDYRERGYPPEAVVNYISFLGWSSHSGKEILSMQELVDEFELERVSDSPSIFDEAKLNWVSSQHVRAGGSAAYFDMASGYFPERFTSGYSREKLERIFDVVSENLPYFAMLPSEAAPFRPGPPDYSEEGLSVLEGKGDLIDAFITGFEGGVGMDREEIQGIIKRAGKECSVKGKELYMPLRAALTGGVHGPDLSTIIMVRGKEDVVGVLKGARMLAER